MEWVFNFIFSVVVGEVVWLTVLVFVVKLVLGVCFCVYVSEVLGRGVGLGM